MTVFIALKDYDVFSDKIIKDLKALSKSEKIKNINHTIDTLKEKK